MITTIIVGIVLLHVVGWGVAGATLVVLGKDRARVLRTGLQGAARGRVAPAVGPGR